MRIALIHALRHSPPPIEDAFKRLWPEATLMNLLDDSLSADLEKDGKLTERMTQRFKVLTQYAIATGADGVLFSCSAFGPCIEAARAEAGGRPVLKPNEAMIEEAVQAAAGGTVGLLATFAPTLATMPTEFPKDARLKTALAEGAMDALNRGQPGLHDALAVQAAKELKDCDVIALAQFSLARAAAAIAAATGKKVLTTPDSAVRKIRKLCTRR
jgi:hypothetical protein